MSAKPDLRDLLEMDPETALDRYSDDYLELAEDLRQRGKDELADMIEADVEAVQEGSA